MYLVKADELLGVNPKQNTKGVHLIGLCTVLMTMPLHSGALEKPDNQQSVMYLSTLQKTGGSSDERYAVLV